MGYIKTILHVLNVDYLVSDLVSGLELTLPGKCFCNAIYSVNCVMV